MRQADRWTESKYVRRGDRLEASRDPDEVGVGSRLITDLVAAFYAEQLPLHARGRLVDLGCGKAPLYGTYRTLVDAVTCVDWPQSPHASLHVDRDADLSGVLPFDDAAFDTIILSDVLEHVAEPERLWREMARILAPRGRALINVPFLYGVHEAPHDYARYTEFALRRFAANAGLAVLLLQPVGGSLHVLADLLGKHLAHVPLIGSVLASAVQGAVSLFDRTAWGRRIAASTGARFPLGYFMVVARPVDETLSEADRAP
jgi:SAM-dependent methyltransferase